MKLAKKRLRKAVNHTHRHYSSYACRDRENLLHHKRHTETSIANWIGTPVTMPQRNERVHPSQHALSQNSTQ